MRPHVATMGFVSNVTRWYFDASWSLLVLMSSPALQTAVTFPHRMDTNGEIAAL
jgi:hypothetical protein